MKISITSPTKAFIEDATSEELDQLRKQLSYTNTSAAHMVKRHYNNKRFRIGSPEKWAEHLEKLKADVHHTLIFDEHNKGYIRPGSIPYITIHNLQIVNNVKYPTPKKVAWKHPLPFELHPYQETSWEELIKVLHGNVELCTGSGKSAILLKLCRETGFRAAIIAPSQSIFLELLEKFEYHFGKGMVGRFGDGKKVLDKRFTICISDSIANIKPGTEEWEFFSKLDMFCADESHTWGAESLDEICHGVLADVPIRFFFSGTQTRGDGAERLLYSIIGKTVCTLTTKEAREKGYICDHDYAIVRLESSNPNYQTPDALDMKRVHFLGNKNIAQFIASFANAQAKLHGRQTLVLVEELSQISTLIPLLTVPYAYAHSEKRASRLAEVGLEKVDKKESVDKFNRNEAKVFMGTSCIATGTNIYPMRYTFNWVGGASEIKTKQGAVGRTVRHGHQNPWKDKCLPKEKGTIIDFDVHDVYLMGRHLEDRVAYYTESGSEIKYIRLSK